MKKTRDTNKIVVPYGNVSKLSKDLGVSTTTINNALKGVRSMSEQTYQSIRNRATDYYGGRYLA